MSAGGQAGGGMATGGSNGASGGSAQAGSASQTCAPHEFAYAADGKPLQSVHVSGTFNSWLEPGTALALDAASNTWKLSLELAAGSYEYKFVLDGKTWVPDPSNPQTRDDTFGGINSVLTVVCP
jgi:1,4-alpha-glucan branching enzyme